MTPYVGAGTPDPAASPTGTTVAQRAQEFWERESRYDVYLQYFQSFWSAASLSLSEPEEPIFLAASGFAGTVVGRGFEQPSSSPPDLAGFPEVGQSEDGLPEGRRSGMRLVRELRQLSGLTWKQAAELVGVQPRTLHNWAAGGTVSEKNRRRLGEILAVLRYIDRGYGEANRDLLLNVSIEGSTLFSLLKTGEADRVKSRAGRGEGRPPPPPPLPPETVHAWGPEHFGRALAKAIDGSDEEIAVPRSTGKRPAKARTKGWRGI